MSNQGFRQIFSWCETPPGTIKEVECACVPIHNASKLQNLPIDPDLELLCNPGDTLIFNGTEWVCGIGGTGPTGPCCTGPTGPTGPGGQFIELTMSTGFVVPNEQGFPEGLIPFDTESAGGLTGYSTSTFKFTAPVDGIYNMNGIVTSTTATGENGVGFRNCEVIVNGNQLTPGGSSTMNAAGRFHVQEAYSGTLTAHLNAGNTMQFSLVQNSGGPYSVGVTGCRLRIAHVA